MTPRKIARAGIGLVLLGTGGLFLASTTGNTIFSVFGWLAIAAGALAFVVGTIRHIAAFMQSDEDAEEEHGPAEVRLLIQSMCAMAAADGQIAKEEIVAISNIHEQMLGTRISDSEISRIASEFKPGFDISGRLRAGRNQLSPLMRQLIMKSCYLVMVSDKIEQREETLKIHEIGHALGFTNQQIDSLTETVS
ncbi:MAG: hypothetical protein ACR2O0_14245 [Rhizobiaceae bacterium]